MPRDVVVGLNAVIVAVTAEEPRVLTVRSEEGEGLPFGPLDPDADRTLELGLRHWVERQTELELGYVEQLYTFGDRDRDAGPERVLSVGYLALVCESAAAKGRGTRWTGVYDLLPWEDLREGQPRILLEIATSLEEWISAASGAERRARRERADITFGLRGAPWDGYRALERYELLYEAGLVVEAERDRRGRGRSARTGAPVAAGEARFGLPLVLDHRRILATALGRLRGKLRYRPVVFELLPEAFTLLQLQRVVEALAGLRLHKQNFRRLVEEGGLVEGTGELERQTGGRPAELFRFRREVLRERPAPGVGLPGRGRRRT